LKAGRIKKIVYRINESGSGATPSPWVHPSICLSSAVAGAEAKSSGFVAILAIRRQSLQMHRITPTTALREPANYDLRGKISTRSNDLTSSLCRQGRRSARAPWVAECF
jgi:hypothetical protein